MEHDATIGERIAHYRRRRGLTQEVCANQVGRSGSWLSQVERGILEAGPASVLMGLATVLKVELAKLLGPALELPPNGGDHHELPRGLPAVSRAIVYPDRFARMAFGGPVDLDDLAARVERARRAWWAGRYTELAVVLADLILAARIATQDSPGSARAWGLLSHCYHLAETLLGQFGEDKLAWIAAERAVAAAERADDAVLMGLGAWSLGWALWADGHLDAAAVAVQDAASLLESGLDGASPERVGVFGTLRLATGSFAAMSGDVGACREAMRDAARVAQLLPDGYVDPWTAFCPGNVAFDDILAWVEAGDPVEALRVADRTDFEALPWPERQGRAWIRVARAHGLRRKDAAATAALLEAERIAPEEVRYHRSVRELVGVLLRRERKSATPGLRGLAGRVGVE